MEKNEFKDYICQKKWNMTQKNKKLILGLLTQLTKTVHLKKASNSVYYIKKPHNNEYNPIIVQKATGKK